MSAQEPAPVPAELVRRLTQEASSAEHAALGPDTLAALCRAAAAALTVDGCTVHVLLEDGVSGVAASSSPAAARLADLAFTAGEGPTIDAFTLRRPVLAGVLGEQNARWPGFTQAAADLGVHAVLSLPLQVGGVALGVLDLYGFQPRSLDEHETAVALAFADLATEVVLHGPSGTPPTTWAPLLDHRAEVHQAQGMIMVDLRVDLREALLRMRAQAFRDGLPLLDLARAIIAGARLPGAETEDL